MEAQATSRGPEDVYGRTQDGEEVIKVIINIPSRLEKPLILLALLYRRLRYGYAFRRIPLTQGKYAIVDPEDYHRLRTYKWYAQKGYSTF